MTCLRPSFCRMIEPVLITANFNKHLRCAATELNTLHALCRILFITTFWNGTFITLFLYDVIKVKRGILFVQIPLILKTRVCSGHYTILNKRHCVWKLLLFKACRVDIILKGERLTSIEIFLYLYFSRIFLKLSNSFIFWHRSN